MENVNVTIDGQTLLAGKKDFSTGSRGYYGNGKVVIEGKRYQVSLNIIEIGSKPTPVAGEKKPKTILRKGGEKTLE